MFPVLIEKNKNGTATERQKSIPLLIEQQFSIKKSISFENTNLLFYKTKLAIFIHQVFFENKI